MTKVLPKPCSTYFTYLCRCRCIMCNCVTACKTKTDARRRVEVDFRLRLSTNWETTSKNLGIRMRGLIHQSACFLTTATRSPSALFLHSAHKNRFLACRSSVSRVSSVGDVGVVVNNMSSSKDLVVDPFCFRQFAEKFESEGTSSCRSFGRGSFSV